MVRMTSLWLVPNTHAPSPLTGDLSAHNSIMNLDRAPSKETAASPTLLCACPMSSCQEGPLPAQAIHLSWGILPPWNRIVSPRIPCKGHQTNTSRRGPLERAETTPLIRASPTPASLEWIFPLPVCGQPSDSPGQTSLPQHHIRGTPASPDKGELRPGVPGRCGRKSNVGSPEALLGPGVASSQEVGRATPGVKAAGIAVFWNC